MNQEEAIFEQALGIDPGEREEFLRGACAGDEVMLERLQGLLRVHDRAGKFMEHERPAAGTPLSSPAAVSQASAAGKDSRAASEQPGDRIGRYKLLQKIGEGGCGVVYMAEQEEPVRRRVALKIIKLGMDTRQVIARFEAERQALAMMDHPNIAKVFDAGVTEGRARHSVRAEVESQESGAQGTDAPYLSSGRPYFVMELVRGVKITEYCDEKKLTTQQRLELFMQVCRAVQHAHQKGIIHRDLKPSNILVSVNDGVAVPKVIDFGIAKATTGERLTEKTVFTAFEHFIGTPAYMSPEQALVTSLDIDTRTDIYSLGVLLYELLTGQTPFDSKELMQAGLDEMRRTIRETEPPKPSTRLTNLVAADVRRLTTLGEQERAASRRLLQEKERLVSQLRGDLDWIVMKCLEKDRARRYETANGLATDIQRHLNNEAVVARPPTNLYRLQKMVHRNKLAFAVGAGIAAALVIGLAFALWQSIEKTRAYREQSRLRQQAEAEAAKSRQIAQYLSEILQDLGPSVTLARDPSMVRELLDRAGNRVKRDLANQPEIAIELWTILAATYGELGLPDKMEEIARTHLELARSTFGDESLEVATALYQLGEALLSLGKQCPEAEICVREALRIRRKLLGNEHLDVARTLRRLGNFLHRMAYPSIYSASAEAACREGLAICAKLGEQTTVEADLLQDLAIELRNGRMDEAEQAGRRSLEIKRKLLGKEHPSVAEALSVLALVLGEEGKLTEAEAVYRELVALTQKLFGRDHHLVGRPLGGLGSTLAAQGRLLEAEPLLREAVALQKKGPGGARWEWTWALADLGQTLEREGRLGEAESVYREVLAIRKKLSANPRGQLLSALARVIRKQGKLAEADALLLEVLAAYRQQADLGEIGAQNELAWLLATHADPEVRDGRAAVQYAEKAVAAARPTNPSYLNTLAAAYAEASNFTKAVTVQKEAMALLRTEAERNDYVSRLKLYEANTPCRMENP